VRRSNRLAYYVKHMEHIGYSDHQVLAETGLDRSRLNEPSYLVDSKQCRQLILNMLELTGDSGLGFEMGKNMSPKDLGIIGNAMMAANSFREAGIFLQRYNELAGGLVRFMFFATGEGEEWKALFEPTIDLGNMSYFCIEEFITLIVYFGRTLTQTEMRFRRIDLAYPQPAHVNLYRETFSCPVHFDQPATCLTVESPGLDTVLPSKDPELSELFGLHCQRLIRQIHREDPTSSKLHALFLRNVRSIPDLETAAVELGISGRTLRRRLQEENCSYRQLINEFRYDFAKELIKAGDLTVNEVSYYLGYENTSAFRRAFRSWSGMTINQYRKSQSFA
jgi:AraC-like DNA-binding protein